MKFHFCQNDHNKITPVMSFISGYFMETIDQTPNSNYFISLEIKSHVNTLLWKVSEENDKMAVRIAIELV